MIDEKKLIEELNNITFEAEVHNSGYKGTRTEKMLCYEDVMSIINKQPKVGEWIPVSERLPKPEGKNEWVKCDVTVIRSHWPTSSYDYCDSPYDEFYVTEAMYNVSQKIWNLSNEIQLNALIDIEDAPLNGDYVIAWQPLPEPYQNDEQEELK